MITLVGSLLIAASVVIHGVGTTWWVRHLAARYLGTDGQLLAASRLRALIATAILLTGLHMIEVLLWALAYLAIVPAGELSGVETALYFSAATFTTLGYGDVTLESEWRLLSGIEAIDGILLIGWSTAMMFAVLQRSWASLEASGTPASQEGRP
ncbi:MAG: potassium channel family protein [Pseudomonadales bacterium]|jgi:voltage-gated potassium channel Kch|nr:potassium channel family protein [Pseudomonadales bacterium]